MLWCFSLNMNNTLRKMGFEYISGGHLALKAVVATYSLPFYLSGHAKTRLTCVGSY